MQRIRMQLVVLFAALTLALGGVGALAVATPESTSAHTVISRISCGGISPYRQVQIAYHPYPGAPHSYYWRQMTAAEYWTYCW